MDDGYTQPSAVLGTRGVNEITSNDVIAVLGPIWHDKPTTAKRVRQWIGAVLTWAVAQGFRPDNPADAVKVVWSCPVFVDPFRRA